MNTQLIPVFVGNISNECTLLCNARDLHQFLGVRRDFSTWIKGRIYEYGFIADADYITVENLTSPKLGNSKSRARAVKDYHLTLDTAKELAMVERNEKGREVRRYFIDCEKQLNNHSQRANHSTSEPLSSQQQERVKRLIWCASHHMRFSQSWSNGVWYALRAATGTPSPQPFSVDDMPILQQEFERILKISAATHNAVYNFEKEVVRLVVRKRQDIEPVLNGMRLELLNIQRLQSEGRLQLEKWDANELARLC